MGDAGNLTRLASLEVAQAWFADNDPEGVAFEYPVIDRIKK